MGEQHLNVTLTNMWGSAITNVDLSHRYDTDHYDTHHWDKLEQGETVGGLGYKVTFWTGVLRTGKDYWQVSFTDADGHRWGCKNNFYCFLTESDAEKDPDDSVLLIITKHNLHVRPPVSSDCDVSIQQLG